MKVEVSLKAAKLGKQLRYAERKGYRWVLIAGADELKAGKVGLKDLESGAQRSLEVEEVLGLVRSS